MNAIGNLILKPGDIVCDWLSIHEEDSRMLFRLFINLTIYAKIFAGLAYLLFDKIPFPV